MLTVDALWLLLPLLAFGGAPKAPPPPPPPPEKTDSEIQRERATAAAMARRRKGRGSQILAGEQLGAPASPQVGGGKESLGG